jgi:hypothetical protein
MADDMTGQMIFQPFKWASKTPALIIGMTNPSTRVTFKFCLSVV